MTFAYLLFMLSFPCCRPSLLRVQVERIEEEVRRSDTEGSTDLFQTAARPTLKQQTLVALHDGQGRALVLVGTTPRNPLPWTTRANSFNAAKKFASSHGCPQIIGHPLPAWVAIAS